MTLPSVADPNASPTSPPPVAAGSKDYLSVIVPIYNEAAHVEELLRSIQAAPVAKEIVIVDDGSTDGTREKLLALPTAENVTVVFHQKNCGKGAAVRTGLRYARGEYVLIQDSDLEYDPQDYAALLRPLQEGKANVVYGVRPESSGARTALFPGRKIADSPDQSPLWRRHPGRGHLLQGVSPLSDRQSSPRVPPL